MQTFGDPFIGCMKQIQVHGLTPESPITTNTRTCSDDLEPGNYFYDKGGYIRLSMFSHNFCSCILFLLLQLRRILPLFSQSAQKSTKEPLSYQNLNVKQRYLWPNKKDLHPPNFFEKIDALLQMRMYSLAMNWISHLLLDQEANREFCLWQRLLTTIYCCKW